MVADLRSDLTDNFMINTQKFKCVTEILVLQNKIFIILNYKIKLEHHPIIPNLCKIG